LSASKYTNLKEEKAKVSKILEELERKQQTERQIKLSKREAALKEENFGLNQPKEVKEYQTEEQASYIKELVEVKPWLTCLPLKSSRLDYLKKNFPLDSKQLLSLQGKDLEEYENEVKFVLEQVVPKKNLLREKKSEYELLLDARYLGKYGEYL